MTIHKNHTHITASLSTKRYGVVTLTFPYKWRYSFGHNFCFYFSPDGTPRTATFMIGQCNGEWNWAVSRIRKIVFGHNFDVLKNKEMLDYINSLNEWK